MRCEQLQRSLWDAKTTGLREAPPDKVLTVQYPDLLTNPAGEVERITELLDLNVRAAQRDSAVDLVQRQERAQDFELVHS
jgi:sulfotransferase family protein